VPGGRDLTAFLQALAVSILGVLPAYLVAALAVHLREEFSIGIARIGLSTALFFTVAGFFAKVSGSLVQRVGHQNGLALSASVSAVALLCGGLAYTFPLLLVALLLGGVSNAIAQPAANLTLSKFISDDRLGLAFGVKQSSVPAATMLGGSALPVLALMGGWRSVWLTAAGAGLLVVAWVIIRAPIAHVRENPKRRGEIRTGSASTMLVLTGGAALAAATSTAVGVFLVDSAVASGMPIGHAGMMLAACSLCGLFSRVSLGWLSDKFPQVPLYLVISGLLVLGALGQALLSIGGPRTILAGSFLAYAAGFAWPGLFHLAVVRMHRHSAAAATGYLQTGLSLGAAAGPLLFGLTVSTASYRCAWVAAGAISLLAAVAVRAGHRRTLILE
jgi:MFS family permease